VATLLTWFLAAVPGILALAAVIAALSLAVAWWRSRRAGWRAAIAATFPDAVLLVALAAIAVLTLGDPSGPQPDRVNLLPFRDQLWAFQGQVDPAIAAATLFANVALFVPLGAALAARHPEASWWWLIGIASFVSLAVEIAQAVMNIGRLADVTDVLANTVGAGMGAALWKIVSAGERSNERSA
jgi:glycopeptide antibiotics resistance protein